MAFFKHFNAKRSKRIPKTRRSTSRGTHWTSATPSVATSRASVATAAKAPSSALRQLTVTPTTRTMVKASTNSTAEAKNAAVKTTHCIEKLLFTPASVTFCSLPTLHDKSGGYVGQREQNVPGRRRHPGDGVRGTLSPGQRLWAV